jgi:hypothetical protein
MIKVLLLALANILLIGAPPFNALILSAALAGGIIVGVASVVIGQHIHPSILPTDEKTWYSCCHEQDCMEGKVRVLQRMEGTALVEVEGYPPFTMPAERVYSSQNGKSYFCRWNINTPPTSTNTICVFIVGGYT